MRNGKYQQIKKSKVLLTNINNNNNINDIKYHSVKSNSITNPKLNRDDYRNISTSQSTRNSVVILSKNDKGIMPNTTYIPYNDTSNVRIIKRITADNKSLDLSRLTYNKQVNEMNNTLVDSTIYHPNTVSSRGASHDDGGIDNNGNHGGNGNNNTTIGYGKYNGGAEKAKDMNLITISDTPKTNSHIMIKVLPKMIYNSDSKRVYMSMNVNKVEDNSSFYNMNYKRLQEMYHSIDLNDSKQIGLSPDVFYCDKQLELNKKINDDILKKTKDRVIVIKKIQPKRKETLYLLPNTSATYKIDCRNKAFPLNFNSEINEGEYEVFFSRNYQRPNPDNYDMLFTETKFTIYQIGEIDHLYFTIMTKKILKMSFILTFTQQKKDQAKRESFHHQLDMKYYIKKRKNTIDFNYDSLSEVDKATSFQLMSIIINFFHIWKSRKQKEDIREKRRREALSLANNKDLIKENKGMIQDFNRRRSILVSSKIKERNEKIFEVLKNKESISQTLQTKRALGLLKKDFKRIEKNARAEAERIAKEKAKFASSWMVLFSFMLVAKEFHTKKIAYITLRIIKQIRENKCRVIQRAWRKYITKENDNIPEKLRYLRYTKISMFYLGSMWKKTANNQSKIIISKCLVEVSKLIRKKNAWLQYRSKVDYIKQKWKRHMLIYKARTHIIAALWDKYMNDILEYEAKSKKKKWTDYIIRMKERTKNKTIKQFLTNRIRKYYQDLSIFHKTIDQNSTDNQKQLTMRKNMMKLIIYKVDDLSRISTPLPPTNFESGKNTLETNSSLNSSVFATYEDAKQQQQKQQQQQSYHNQENQQKPKFKVIPKNEELKPVIENLLERLKKEKEAADEDFSMHDHLLYQKLHQSHY